jgi:hypothetical protein
MGNYEVELGKLLDRGNPPEYVRWNRKRIVSCIDFLSEAIPLRGLRTLDIGHDVHVGSLLKHSGCDLRGNVAPPELRGPELARETASYMDPEGRSQLGVGRFRFRRTFPIS